MQQVFFVVSSMSRRQAPPESGSWKHGPLFTAFLTRSLSKVKNTTQYAHVAQSAEHFLGKEEVTGSNPVVGSITLRIRLVHQSYGNARIKYRTLIFLGAVSAPPIVPSELEFL